MTTIYRNPSLTSDGATLADKNTGSPTYQEPDTRIPPKARPVLDSISVNGVLIEETSILSEAQNHPADNPGGAVLEAARALVVRELLLQEAERLGIVADPSCGSAKPAQTQDDVMIHRLIEREVAIPSATEEECHRYFGRNPARFRSEPIYEARHILVSSTGNEKSIRDKARDLALSLVERLQVEPEQFAELALQYSDCPSRDQGGNLGQLTQGSTVPEFETMLKRMKAGTLCKSPVESRFGFHVIRLDRKVPGEQLPFDLVRERIAAWLDASAWSKAVAQYISVLAGRAQIEGIDLNSADGPLIQ